MPVLTRKEDQTTDALLAEEIRDHGLVIRLRQSRSVPVHYLGDSTPKAGHAAANAHEKEVLSFRRKLWIDEADYELLKSVYTVVGQHIVFLPGTTLTWEFAKINNDVWLSSRGVIDGHLQFAKFIKPAVRTEYKYSKFQKFDVQSTVTALPVK